MSLFLTLYDFGLDHMVDFVIHSLKLFLLLNRSKIKLQSSSTHLVTPLRDQQKTLLAAEASICKYVACGNKKKKKRKKNAMSKRPAGGMRQLKMVPKCTGHQQVNPVEVS